MAQTDWRPLAAQAAWNERPGQVFVCCNDMLGIMLALVAGKNPTQHTAEQAPHRCGNSSEEVKQPVGRCVGVVAPKKAEGQR